MKSIAQKKARLNGWIKTYETRVEQYKAKYGERSRLGKLHIGVCKSKIQAWKKTLKSLTFDKQIDKAEVVKFLYTASNTYFGIEISFPFEGVLGSLEKAPERYYFSKLIVDLGLCCDESCLAVNATKRPMYARRNALTKNTSYRTSYKAYKTSMLAELEAANLNYK